MASFKQWFVVALILSMTLTSASIFYTGFARENGISSTDLSTLNRTQAFRDEIESFNEQLAGKSDEITDFGVFTKTLRAVGSIFNLLLNIPQLIFGLITDFNTQVAGGNFVASYILLTIEAIIIISFIFLIARAIVGGRV